MDKKSGLKLLLQAASLPLQLVGSIGMGLGMAFKENYAEKARNYKVPETPNWLLSGGSGGGAQRKRWSCTKCGCVTVSAGRPIAGHCGQDRNGGGHSWRRANEFNALSTWSCSKCGCTTRSDKHPTTGHCGQGGNHSWHRR